MAQESQTPNGPVLERVPTGIPGLDEVLRGGLVRGDVYLVGGRPGTGKTTFGNHLAYNHARAGGVSLFVTVLAETHDRMRAHLRGFDFLALPPDARPVAYLNMYDELSQNGLQGVLALLRRLIREQGVTMLVVDGADLFADFAPSPLEHRRFIHLLQAQFSLLGCTTVLLADLARLDGNPISTHVDGAVILEDENYELRDVRFLHVIKLRGVSYLRGRHYFSITGAGITVHPRLEVALSPPSEAAPQRQERLRFGVPGLDDMLRGGLVAGSTTLLLGASGTGKTVSGLHFLTAGARRGEPGLLAGFHETPGRLIAKAEALGLDLERQVAEGRIRLLWQPPREVVLDAWAGELLAATAEQPAQHLFIDGLNDILRLALFTRRLPIFLAALLNELRARGVTTLCSAETSTLIGLDVTVPVPAFSSVVENIILLRFVEPRSRLHRLVSILKTRESDYDATIREFRITPQGIVVAETFDSAAAVLADAGSVDREERVAGRRRETRSSGWNPDDGPLLATLCPREP